MIITGVLFEIRIDGKIISPLTQSNLKQIELVQQTNSFSTLKIHLAWDTYFEFKEKFIRGTELQLSLPYRNELVPVFSGKISGLFAESDFVTGTSLRLEAKDYLFDLKHADFEIATERYSLVRLIRELCSSEQYNTKIEHVADIQDRFIITGKSKFDVLLALCDEFGLYFYLKDRALSIFPLTHIPFDSLSLDITPIIPNVIDHADSEGLQTQEQKVIYFLERNNKDSETLQMNTEHKIGGNVLSDPKTGSEKSDKIVNVDLACYRQSDYKDAYEQYFVKNSLNEVYEFSIPGNPLIHPGMILRLKDEHYFVTDIFVGKVIHKLDDLGYSSMLECYANSRRE